MKIDEIGADSNVGVDEEPNDYADIDQEEYVPNDSRKGMKYRKYPACFKLAVVDFFEKKFSSCNDAKVSSQRKQHRFMEKDGKETQRTC
jgi:hypothetical protein